MDNKFTTKKVKDYIKYNLEQPKIIAYKNLRKKIIATCAGAIHRDISVNLHYSCLGKLEINRLIQRSMNKSQIVLDKYLPPIEGDEIIQIATCFLKYGERKTYRNHILTLGTCDPIEGVEVVECKTEEELIMKWRDLLFEEDVDGLLGYNTSGFDFPYIWDRADELGCLDKYKILGKLQNRESTIQTKTLTSAALGHNSWREISTVGRIQIDLLKVMQRDHNLESYKLDNVSSHFMNGSINSIIEETDEYTVFTTNSVQGLQKEAYVKFTYQDGHTKEKHKDGQKYQIISITDNKVKIAGRLGLAGDYSYSWTMAKDDVTPQDIFRLQRQGPAERCIVAKYCVKDVILCVELMLKLSIIPNNIGMANVCYVPFEWIFTRGQGIKIFSLVSRQCRLDNMLIPTLYLDKNAQGYEGAVVLIPKPDIYLDSSVSVLDYSSLYPSSIISENISHNTIITDDKYLGEKGAKRLKKLGYDYVDITYDNFKYIDVEIKTKENKRS